MCVYTHIIYIYIYMYVYMYILAYIIWELGVAYKRAAGAFFLRKSSIPGFFDYVNSGNCQNCQNFNIYGFGDLSKKTRAEKSWILAVLRPPDLSPRPDWWPKRWMVRTPQCQSNTGLACVRLDDVPDHSKSVRTSVFAWPVWHGSSGTAPLIHAVGGMSWPWHELPG